MSPCPMCGEAFAVKRDGVIVARWCHCGCLGRQPESVVVTRRVSARGVMTCEVTERQSDRRGRQGGGA
jgi:hypothetical protein